jgi:ferredoxin
VTATVEAREIRDSMCRIPNPRLIAVLRRVKCSYPKGSAAFEEAGVAYIICEPCIGTKDTACVDVCPVDCIHPRKDEPEFEAAEMLYIHPDECIDCGACVPACPVEAIFALDETPEKWKNFIPVNAEYYQK